MKQMSSAVTAILAKPDITSFVLIALPGFSKYYTSAPFDITMSDGNTYLSSAPLRSIDPPRFSTTVDRESFKVTFNDPSYSLRGYFENGATGDPLIIRACFWDPVSNQVLTNMNDTFIAYHGIIDNHSFTVDFKDSEVTVLIEGASPFASLDMKNTFYTSKESMRTRYPNDSAFDEVHVSSGRSMLKWGKT